MTTVPSLPDPPAPELRPAPANFQRDLQRQARQAARSVQRFVKSNPSQQLTLDNKKYPRVETWQFLGALFGQSALITSTQELLGENSTELGFVAVAHVRNREAQIVTGAEAVCMRSEPEWSGRPSFQLRSMAQTRAIAKAFRNELAWVMVMAGFCPTPAEEMEVGQVSFEQIESAPTPKVPKVGAKLVTTKQISSFQEICATHGKTLQDVAEFLSRAFNVKAIEELQRGRQFTKALQWAVDPLTADRKPQQAALRLLDSIPKHKDAYSL